MNLASLCADGRERYIEYTAMDARHKKTGLHQHASIVAWQRWLRHAKKCKECGDE